MQKAIDKEINRGHTAGPFPYPPFKHCHCSPIGSTPKKDLSLRLIMDLSQPEGSSINENISKEDFSVQYSHFDDAVDLVNAAGRGCLMSKLDIEHAYRLLPVRPDQWHQLCYFWEGNYYVDLVLPFGMRSSAGIFNKFASLVRWIIKNEYGIDAIVNYSDDFFLVSSPDPMSASQDLAVVIAAFADMGIPLAKGKVEGPSTSLIYLGILLNSALMLMQVPQEKYIDIMGLLTQWGTRKTCTKRELLSLIGKLGSICKVVRPGRMFSRRLIDLSTTVAKMHHHINLNKEACADISWWKKFLPDWDQRSLIPIPHLILSSDLKLFTDASDQGYGAVYGSAWIQGSWGSHKHDHSIDYRELFAIVAAAMTWGHDWSGRRVVFITDNKPITQVWHSGSSPSPELMSLIRPLFLFAAHNGFSVAFKHIYGSKNVIADALSRFQMDVFRTSHPGADELPTVTNPAAWLLW